MQLQQMLFILFMLIIIPVLIISSNDSAFFILLSIIIFYASIKSINQNVFKFSKSINHDADDLLNELEDQTDLDIHHLGKGLLVIKDLVIILFFSYCNFYIPYFLLKLLSILVIFYWVIDITLIVKISDKSNDKKERYRAGPKMRFFSIFTNLLSIFLVSITAYIKFVIFS